MASDAMETRNVTTIPTHIGRWSTAVPNQTCLFCQPICKRYHYNPSSVKHEQIYGFTGSSNKFQVHAYVIMPHSYISFPPTHREWDMLSHSNPQVLPKT